MISAFNRTNASISFGVTIKLLIFLIIDWSCISLCSLKIFSTSFIMVSVFTTKGKPILIVGTTRYFELISVLSSDTHPPATSPESLICTEEPSLAVLSAHSESTKITRSGRTLDTTLLINFALSMPVVHSQNSYIFIII